jgi:gliding motility-associated-like protein
MVPSGIYVVSVFDDRGCVSDSIYIIMEPNPILVTIDPVDPVIDLGDSLFISGTVIQSDEPIVMTVWTSQEPVSCASCPGTWVFNSLPTVYTWTVTDANGCQGSAFVIVDVDYDRDVYIPNIFSPNGDGRNDNFRIFTGLGVVSINYLHIFDRWGNLIHSEQNLLPNGAGAGNWDGTSNGKALSPGVYVYVAEITFVDNNTTLVYRGDVTLIK